MTAKRLAALLAAAAATATLLIAALAALAALAAPAGAAIRHLDGTVLSKNAKSRSFQMRTEHGAIVRIRVNAATKYERISGFGALRRGLAVEVDAQTTRAGLLAKEIETQGDRGRGDDDGRGDDRGGHGSDERGGDDHGGHGADDGPNHS